MVLGSSDVYTDIPVPFLTQPHLESNSYVVDSGYRLFSLPLVWLSPPDQLVIRESYIILHSGI